jgi:hypothetical protein
MYNKPGSSSVCFSSKRWHSSCVETSHSDKIQIFHPAVVTGIGNRGHIVLRSTVFALDSEPDATFFLQCICPHDANPWRTART